MLGRLNYWFSKKLEVGVRGVVAGGWWAHGVYWQIIDKMRAIKHGPVSTAATARLDHIVFIEVLVFSFIFARIL